MNKVGGDDENMMTVRDVANLTGVTVKTLHHYHKIGLLQPTDRSAAGYRLYGKEELKILQEILFYKELDIPLKEIKKLIQENKSRKDVLVEQQYLMHEKMKHLDNLTKRIDEAIKAEESGTEMDEEAMFRGVTLSQWMKHIETLSEEIEEKYDVDVSEIDIDEPLLRQALGDVEDFIKQIENFLEKNTSVNDPELQQTIADFLTHWNASYEEPLTIENFLNNSWKDLTDDFQRQLFPVQQLGLQSYLYVAGLVYKENQKVEGEKNK